MKNKPISPAVIDGLVQELRRGTIVLAALSQLNEPQYGYSLLKSLSEKGFDIDQGTLYPLLRRLEANSLLESDWRVEGSRPRRYYVLSESGRNTLQTLEIEWRTLTDSLNQLLSE